MRVHDQKEQTVDHCSASLLSLCIIRGGDRTIDNAIVSSGRGFILRKSMVATFLEIEQFDVRLTPPQLVLHESSRVLKLDRP